MFKKVLFSALAKILLTVLSLFIVFGTAAAQENGVHQSYVSIEMRSDALDSNPITRKICGGVIVEERRKLVATAWHCVPNRKSIIEKPRVFFIGGVSATLVTFSPEADTAIFQVNDLKNLKVPAFKTPKKGDVLVASAVYDAFPVTVTTGDRFVPPMNVKVTLNWEGKVVAVANANRIDGERYDKITQTQFEWIVVTGDTAPGFSGGPVFDKKGNFVGIISNVNGGFTNVSSSKNVADMLKAIK